MSRRSSWLVLGSLALAATAGLAAEPSVQWKVRMARLSAALVELLPDVASGQRFRAPRHQKRILHNAQLIVDLAHDVKVDPAGPQPDPTVAILSASLVDEARDAVEALKRGNHAYARTQLFNVANTCIGCHARTADGPQFTFPATVAEDPSLTPLERGTLLAAMRRFDDALGVYGQIVTDPQAPIQRGLDWDRAATAGLAVSVRTLRDPARALKIVDGVLANAGAPEFMKHDALGWRAALLEWQAEPDPGRDGRTEAGLHARARALVDQALRGSVVVSSRAAFVTLLRATTLLHEQLNVFPTGPLAADALHELGLAYTRLEELEQWTLAPRLFEACIRRRPHSDVAMRCFDHLQAAAFAEHTGTGSPHLPTGVSRQLQKFLQLARPLTPESP